MNNAALAEVNRMYNMLRSGRHILPRDDLEQSRLLTYLLKENERLHKLAAIVENSHDAIYSVSLDGTILTWNKGAERLFGYRMDEVIGKKLQKTIIPFERQRELVQVLASLKQKKPLVSLETTRKKKSGEKFLAHLSRSYIYDTYGNVVGVSIIARDITQKEKGEVERRTLLAELDTLIKMAPIGIAFLDNNLRYIKINKMLAMINGRSGASHIGKTPEEVLPKRLSVPIMQNLAWVLRTRQPFTFEMELGTKTRAKDARWVSATYYPMHITRRLYGVGTIVQDITEQKLLEKRKDDFISMASHELKTPVTTIKAYVQILQSLPTAQFDNKDAYLSKAEVQVDRLTKIITGLLDLSKIRTGRMSIVKEHFAFDDLITDIIQTYSSTHKERKFVIRGHTEKRVYADRNRVEQVVINFLNNALKYSPGKKKIEVLLTSTKTHVKLGVRDYGIGISKTNQAKIFQSFYRVVERDDSEFSGLGIGLYIASEIIKLHSGRIWVKSEKGKGSLFAFALPIR